MRDIILKSLKIPEPPEITFLCKEIQGTYLASRKSTITFEGQKFIPDEFLKEKLNKIASKSLGNTQRLDFNTLRKLLYLLSKFSCNDPVLLRCVWESLEEKLKYGEKAPHDTTPLRTRNVTVARLAAKKIPWISMSRECLILPFCASLTHQIFYSEKGLNLVNSYIKSMIRSRLYCKLEDSILAYYGYKTLFNHYLTAEMEEMLKLVNMYKDWRFSEISEDDVNTFITDFTKVYPNFFSNEVSGTKIKLLT